MFGLAPIVSLDCLVSGQALRASRAMAGTCATGDVVRAAFGRCPLIYRALFWEPWIAPGVIGVDRTRTERDDHRRIAMSRGHTP
jgi:hypothetical protein